MDTLSTQEKLKILIAIGMTESCVSEKTGIAQPTINRIKNGQEPGESKVRVIDSFFFEEMKSIPANDRKILRPNDWQDIWPELAASPPE